MSNIIAEMIDISKIESNQMEVHKKQTCVNELLDNQYQFSRKEAKKNTLKYKRLLLP